MLHIHYLIDFIAQFIYKNDTSIVNFVAGLKDHQVAVVPDGRRHVVSIGKDGKAAFLNIWKPNEPGYRIFAYFIWLTFLDAFY
jgi:hypothetical protein